MSKLNSHQSHSQHFLPGEIHHFTGQILRQNKAVDIKSLTSAEPEAKYSQIRFADGHRMTPEMDEALKGGGVWKAVRLHWAQDGGKSAG